MDKLHQGIQLSSIWLQTSSQEVHKAVQTSPSLPTENGNEAGDIHRRHYHSESKLHSSVTGQRHCDLFATVPGVCNQLDQVPARTNTVIGILGVPSEFCLDDLSFTRTESREYSKEVPLSLEQPIIINSSNIRYNNVRCMKDLMWSNMQHCSDRGAVECRGKWPAHKYLGIHGGEFHSENILQKQKQHSCTLNDGQYTSPLLHFKIGRDKECDPLQHSQRPLGVLCTE